ncbi:MAG: hypothetical protein ABIR03_09900, partial [Ginsengibacter sp.]
MKTFITAIFILFNSFFSNAQVAISWYKVFTGKVGNMNATMHLSKSAEYYSGYIWFDQNQWPMLLYSGEPPSKNDSIYLSASSGPLSIVLTGVLNDNNFTGKSILQKENGGSKNAGFQMQVSPGKTFTPFEYAYTKGSGKLLPKIKNESTCDYYSGTV